MPEVAEATQERARAELASCEDCGYELTFVRGAACPECGAPATLMLPELSRRYLAVRRVMLGATLILWGVPGAAFVFLLVVSVMNWRGEGEWDALRVSISAAFVPVCALLCGGWLLASPLGDSGNRARWGLRTVCVVTLAVSCTLMAERVVARMPGGGTGPPPLVTTFDVREKVRWALLALSPAMGAALLLVCAAVARDVGMRRTAGRWSVAAWCGAGLVCALIAVDFVAQWAWNRTATTSTTAAGVRVVNPGSPAYYPAKAVLARLAEITVAAAWVCVTWMVVLRARMLLARIPRPSPANGPA